MSLNDETKQLQKEISDLKEQRLRLERDKVEEVRKLQADYKARGKNTINEAAAKISPLALVHQTKLVNLNRDLKIELARVEKDIEEQIVLLRRSKQSQLTKAKNEADSKRDELLTEHKLYTTEIERQMLRSREDLVLESGVGVEVMVQEYDARIDEIDEQLSVLEEALAIDKGDDEDRKRQIRSEANKRREARQTEELARRKKALEDSIKAQGGPLKVKTLKVKKPSRRERRATRARA